MPIDPKSDVRHQVDQGAIPKPYAPPAPASESRFAEPAFPSLTTKVPNAPPVGPGGSK
jgi:hypothetical protein